MLYIWKQESGKDQLEDIEEFFLLDMSRGEYMYEYLTHGVLFSTKARAVWVEPDVKELEFVI